ncbi:SDR family oxidoreductase [Streptomyces sp. HB2AG]|uniref:SDR family oxidoreductase n=1 Tax=Streptomyces sp. HB2AG TaxID=2983400 RepID=UPI0022A9F9F4|nr:SDR family oxidoreductase [Streptomyces sp. HB2AG]MCZ2525870.1 SDR family oxidoreductase [Streptomyces sp. HB2AG]
MSVLSHFRLDGRVALVSGAGRGIGAASALALAEAGADVAVLARTQEQIDDVADRVRALGRRAVAVRADAGSPEDTAEAVATAVRELGRLDTVVCVTGGSGPKPFLRTGDDALRDAFDRNVVHGLRLVREAVPHLVRSDGASVVMISSAIGHLVGRGYVAYGAGKAALDHSVRLLADELNPRIRINAIAPGAVRTEALDAFTAADPSAGTAMERAAQLRRIGTPEDIAAAVLYLASPASSYVTGQVLAVDGGLLASNLPMPYPDL